MEPGAWFNPQLCPCTQQEDVVSIGMKEQMCCQLEISSKRGIQRVGLLQVASALGDVTATAFPVTCHYVPSSGSAGALSLCERWSCGSAEPRLPQTLRPACVEPGRSLGKWPFPASPLEGRALSPSLFLCCTVSGSCTQGSLLGR